MLSMHAGADGKTQGSVTVFISLVIALVVGPFVLLFGYGFVCGVIEGMRSGSGRTVPVKEPSMNNRSDWWIVGRAGERFRVSVKGDPSQK